MDEVDVFFSREKRRSKEYLGVGLKANMGLGRGTLMEEWVGVRPWCKVGAAGLWATSAPRVAA